MGNTSKGETIFVTICMVIFLPLILGGLLFDLILLSISKFLVWRGREWVSLSKPPLEDPREGLSLVSPFLKINGEECYGSFILSYDKEADIYKALWLHKSHTR